MQFVSFDSMARKVNARRDHLETTNLQPDNNLSLRLSYFTSKLQTSEIN